MSDAIDKPSKANRSQHDIWLAWYALRFLLGRAEAGSPYVPVTEFRAELMKECADTDELASLLSALRMTGLAGVLYLKGRRNRQYYLTQIGQAILPEYTKHIRRK